jgi:hypothetical protein
LLEDSASSQQPISSATTIDTLVHDPEEDQGRRETMKEIITEEIINEDKARPPSPAHPRAEIPPDNLNTRLSPSGLEVDDGRRSLTDNNRKVGILPLPVHERSFGILPSWLRELFGHRDKFLHDWESQELEAFVIHENPPTLFKLPFGHQRLTFGLKRMMKKNKCLSWDQYLSLDSQHHRDIHLVIFSAKQIDARDRTFLAVDIHGKKQGAGAEGMLVFFSLGAAVKPVHLTDCIRRKFSLPFEHCRTWTVNF